jgi:cob(I)alamin adenosyltransferase
MVKLNKIYTRTGDKGMTALVTGPRRRKDDLRVEAYGTVDETNSVIGLARLHTREDAVLDAILARIQNELFDLGADLSTPETGENLGFEALRIISKQVKALERDIDTLNGALSPLTSFVLPAGSAASAHLHQARTVSRRAERLMVSLSQTEDEIVGEAALAYINRLSDFLFVAARHANGRGGNDVLWVPGGSR